MHQQMTIKRVAFRLYPFWTREIIRVLSQTYQKRFDEFGIPYFCKVARVAEIRYDFNWLGYQISYFSTDIINP